MDVTGSSGSSALSSYQAALAAGGQQTAVFQALTNTYSTANAGSDSTDPLTALVAQSNNSSLVSAIYTQGQALQASSGTGATSGIQGLGPSQIVGGLDSSAASTLLQGLSTSSGGADGLQGFDAALGGQLTLATASAQARQTYGSGNFTAAAQAQATADQNASGTTTTTTSGDTVTGTTSTGAIPAYIQQATAAAQLAAMNNTFSLLA